MLLHSRPSPVPVIDSDRDDWWRHARCAAPDRDMWTSDNLGDKLSAAHQCIAHCPVLARCHTEARNHTWRGTAVGGLVYSVEGLPIDLEPPRYCSSCQPLPPISHPCQRLTTCERCGREFVADHPMRRQCRTEECKRVVHSMSRGADAGVVETAPR